MSTLCRKMGLLLEQGVVSFPTLGITVMYTHNAGHTRAYTVEEGWQRELNVLIKWGDKIKKNH